MSTIAQITANRENSTHSTGPVTAAGKSTSSRNGFKHGLSSVYICDKWEKREDYLALQADLVAEYKPTNTTENLLVRDMAKYHWLADRAIKLQTEELERSPMEIPKTLALLIRYQTTHHRAFHKALSTLLSIRKEARKQEIGFASQPAVKLPPEPAPKPPAPAVPTPENAKTAAAHTAPPGNAPDSGV